jgi:hypothetical protein
MVRDKLYKENNALKGRQFVLDWLETLASGLFEDSMNGTLFDCNLLDSFAGLNLALTSSNNAILVVKLSGCGDH